MILNTLIAALTIVLFIAALATTLVVYAQILDKDPPITIPITGNMTDLPQRDVSIDVLDEPLPANGTTSISTTGANDIDITSMPPAGYTIVITNDTASVTNHVVTIPTAEPTETAAADNGNSDSTNEDDDEEG